MQGLTLAGSAQLVQHLFAESDADARALATIGLGVIEGKQLKLGVILEMESGEIRRVTRFEELMREPPLTLSADSFERLWQATAHHKPAAALLCDRATFEGLARAEDKLNYLAAVGHAQPYFYRVEFA